MGLLEEACRSYQRLFPGGHAAEAALGRLHADATTSGNWELFHRTYFEDEIQKGRAALHRFSAISREWVGGRALDFGAGAGGLTCSISELTREAVGIDVQADKLDFARREAERRGFDRVRFIHYDGHMPLPFEEATFDCIFCIDVVEHLPTPERFVSEFHRLLKPGGLLLLSFGPPWGHAHGKHMWTALPGWWSHLIFPRKTVMRVLGRPDETTYEQLGIFRLTVGKYERVMQQSAFESVHQERLIKRVLAPLKYVPGVRELLISEVVDVYRKNAPGRSHSVGT